MSSTHTKGRIFVLSAPSGGGKTTLINHIKHEFPMLEETVSCTTRSPREGETDGDDYIFLSREEFLEKKDRGFFLEWAEVHGYLYGTPRGVIAEKLEANSFLICDVDIQGALNIKRIFPEEAVLIFIMPPSMEELRKRLENRALDDTSVVERRLSNAKQEISHYHNYRYIIVNDEIEKAAVNLEHILYAEINCSIARNMDVISRFI